METARADDTKEVISLLRGGAPEMGVDEYDDAGEEAVKAIKELRHQERKDKVA